MRPLLAWSPAAVLLAGAVLTLGVDLQQELPLRAPLAATLPQAIGGRVGRDLEIDPQELATAGPTAYLLRDYRASDPSASNGGFSLYVGYYATQQQGKTIHSPRNCLPGSGWEVLQSERATIAGPDGRPVAVNRYLIQHGARQALVLYWYQGRGRIEPNEYKVKWDLLRDAAFRGRSDEALVRIVADVETDVESAFQVAAEAASAVIGPLSRTLPG